MSDDIRVAIIAGLVSLVVSMLAILSTWITVFAQRKDLERQIQNQFTDKVYSLRVEYYPRAFELTEQIQRRAEPQRIIGKKELQHINRELFEWKTGKVSLIISGKALDCFYALRDALDMGHGEHENFNLEQVEKIFTARNNFRSSLRQDIGLLHEQDRSGI